jgi:type I restriction enzyme S subunit
MSSAIEASIQLRKKRHEANVRLDTFTPALFNKMFGDPQVNPMKWPLKHLGDEQLADFRYGTSAKCHTEVNGLPVLRIPNVLHGDINLLDLKHADLQDAEIQRLVLLSNDILFVRTNGNREYVGRCAVFDLQDQYLFASYLIRARLDVSRLNPWFLTSFLRSDWGRKVLSPLIRTTAGQSNISVDGLKRILLPVPPVEVQNHFATIIGQTRLIAGKQASCSSMVDSVFDNLLNGLL